jgi:hypothetical protein
MTEKSETEVEWLSLDDLINETIKRSEEDPEQDYLYNVLSRLTTLVTLQNHVRQIRSELTTTRDKLKDLQRSASTSMDMDVHVRVEISQLNKRRMNAKTISRYAWEHPPKPQEWLDPDRNVEMLKHVIETVAHEAAFDLLSEW